ncbi:acyltransferase family protein [Aeromicrobium sp. CF4.19]|uniref:acyltransferase family protein n=1 Tax=Aeromicrobium sp. CF4.19 TaxID=3373082 RepID=UPI003EE58083
MTAQPASSVSPRPRFRVLDSLRLVAAMMVLLYHYTAFNHSHWGVETKEQFQFISRFTAYGATGVQLFFIISGFVILLSANGRTLPQFVTSRVSRLYPAYWVAVLSAAFLYVFIAPGTFKDISVDMVLANLTMTQEALNVPHVDGVYWTLWVELLFYVLIGGLLVAGLTEARVTAFIFLWPLLAAVAQSADASFLTAILSPTYASLFCGGMALCLIHLHGHSTVRWLLVGFNACIAAHQTAERWVLGSIAENTEQDVSATVGVVIILAMFAAVAIATVTPVAHLGPAWLTTAGALTYPLYLFHEAWGWWFLSVFGQRFDKWVVLGGAIAFTLAIAFAVERWVERPVRPRLAGALQRSFSREATGSAGERPRGDSA